MLLLVRHGETEANRAGLHLGRADPPLTDVGHHQAKRVANQLPVPDVVVSSPLRRARETADVLAGQGCDVEVDARWIELDYGTLDLVPVGAGLPADVLARWRDDPTFAPPGVETVAAVSGRVVPACEELIVRAESSVVVVVSHVSPIKAAIGWALGADPTALALAGRLFVEDAGVSRIDVVDGRPVVRWFNRLVDH